MRERSHHSGIVESRMSCRVKGKHGNALTCPLQIWSDMLPASSLKAEDVQQLLSRQRMSCLDVFTKPETESDEGDTCLRLVAVKVQAPECTSSTRVFCHRSCRPFLSSSSGQISKTKTTKAAGSPLEEPLLWDCLSFRAAEAGKPVQCSVIVRLPWRELDIEENLGTPSGPPHGFCWFCP